MTKSAGVRNLFLKKPTLILPPRAKARPAPAPARRLKRSAPQSARSSGKPAIANAVNNVEEGQANLLRYICSKYALGEYHATDVAALSHYLTRCNLPVFRPFALNPEAPDFVYHASRKVQETLQINRIEKEFTRFQAPMCHPESCERAFEDVVCWSFADVLSQEFASRPDEIIAASSLTTKNWADNPHRQAGEAAGDFCVGFGLFIDGAAWKGKGAGTRESVLAYYVNILGEREP